MENLTLVQAEKLIDDVVTKVLNNYNAKHPNNNIIEAEAFKYGYLQVELALLLTKHNSIEHTIDKYLKDLPMDK